MRVSIKVSSAVILLVSLLALFPSGLKAQLRPQKTFVYTNNSIGFGPNSVSAFEVQSDSSLPSFGGLEELKGSPFSTGGAGGGGFPATNQIAVAGTFLYAANSGSSDISAFLISKQTGELMPVKDAATGKTIPPVASGLTDVYEGIALATTPDGRILYASTFHYSFLEPVSAFRIESSGALSPIQSQIIQGQTGIFGASSLKVSPDGKFLAALTTPLDEPYYPFSYVTIFGINSEGMLKQEGPPFPLDGTVMSLEFNCASNLLYATLSGSTGMGIVAVLEIDSYGNLKLLYSPISFETFQEGTSLTHVLSPDDLHLYVTNQAYRISGSLVILEITPGAGGRVQPVNLVPFEASPSGIATNQRGDLLYLATKTIRGGPPIYNLFSVVGYKIDNSIDQTTGHPTQTLTQVQPSALNPTPALLPGSNGASVAVFPPKACFGNLAAQQAQKDTGGLYGSGGKGFDFTRKPDASGVVGYTGYTMTDVINDKLTGYLYYASNGPDSSIARAADLYNPKYPKQFETSEPRRRPPVLLVDYGMDCSGLVLWSYNSAVQTTIQQAPGDALPGPNALEFPILYEGAGEHGQCSTNQSTFLVNDVLDPITLQPKLDYHHPIDLRPGDLLCFTYRDGGPHVAMYLGSDVTIEEYTRSTIPARNGVVVGHIDSRVLQDAGDFTNCSSVNPTKPCFQFNGYWRPKSASAAILWQVDTPVSLSVTDPDGFTVRENTWVLTEHEASRSAGNLFYSDYSPSGEDMVFSPTLKTGAYVARVIPKTFAGLRDTYSLTVSTGAGTLTLAHDVPIDKIPGLGYGIISNGTSITPFIPVPIDIEPKRLNPERMKRNHDRDETMKVVILSTSNFDPLSQVDTSSLTFGETGTEPSLAYCKHTDTDSDSRPRMALICHFYIQKTGFRVGDIKGVLQGKTVDGQLFRGEDSIRMVSHDD